MLNEKGFAPTPSVSNNAVIRFISNDSENQNAAQLPQHRVSI